MHEQESADTCLEDVVWRVLVVRADSITADGPASALDVCVVCIPACLQAMRVELRPKVAGILSIAHPLQIYNTLRRWQQTCTASQCTAHLLCAVECDLCPPTNQQDIQVPGERRQVTKLDGEQLCRQYLHTYSVVVSWKPRPYRVWRGWVSWQGGAYASVDVAPQ